MTTLFQTDISNIEMITQCVLNNSWQLQTAAVLCTHNPSVMIQSQIQDRVYEEIQTVLARQGLRIPSRRTLRGSSVGHSGQSESFRASRCLFDETLRVYAPANFIERTALEDITVETEDKKHRLTRSKWTNSFICQSMALTEMNDSGSIETVRLTNSWANETRNITNTLIFR